MKQFTNILFVAILSFGLFSCSGDDDNSSSTDNNQTFTELYKKWEIQSASPTTSANGITSFDVDLNAIESIEFTDGGVFVIVETDGEVTTGNYTIEAATSKLNLVDIGTITINELSDSNLDFTFELTNETLNLIAQPAQEISTNSVNQEMFRLWTVQNLDAINDGNTEPSEISVNLEVLFTPYGTYLIKDETQDGEVRVENSFWQWKNDEQKEVCYKFEENEAFECDEDFFRIESLTSSEFRLLDLPDSEDELEYILIPVN